MPILSAGRRAAVALATVLVACGGGGGGAGAGETALVAGVRVSLDTTAAFAHAPDFESRLTNTIDAALRYWGGTWDDVAARTITLVDDDTVSCRGRSALGCFDGNFRVTTRDPGVGTVSCIEETVLVHEIGHAVIGDPTHSDPRWMEMDALADELAGRVGYTESGETTCVTYVSVWRHALNSP